LLVNVNIYPDVAARSVGGGLDGANVRVAIAGSQHELFHGTAKLLNATSAVTSCELSNCTVDIRLPPQQTGPIIEQIEVVGVISLLLNDLELYVLVIQGFVVNGAVGIRESGSGKA